MSHICPDNLSLVAEFMHAFEQPVSLGFFSEQTAEALALGMKLIAEENMELSQAALVLLDAPAEQAGNAQKHFIKELADLLFVVYWLASALGIDLDEAFRQVWQSNMSKLGPDGKPVKRADGKVLKGPAYKEPDLSALVRNTPIAL